MDTLFLSNAIYFRKIAFTDKIAFMDKIAFTDKNCLYRQKLPLQTKIAFTDILLGQPTFYNYVNAGKLTLFCVHEGKKDTKIAKWPSRTYHFHEGKKISTKASVKAIFATKAA